MPTKKTDICDGSFLSVFCHNQRIKRSSTCYYHTLLNSHPALHPLTADVGAPINQIHTIMKTFESRFEDYYVALGNAEQVRIYNHFAGANLCPLVYDSEDIDEVFENLTPKQIINLVKKGDFKSCHDWFYINDMGYIQGIEIVPEWLEKYIPAMAKYYSQNGNVLVAIDADAEILFSDNEDDYARHILDKMTLPECITMWNESASDHYQKMWEIHAMDEESWWNYLAKELGGFDLMQAVRKSENFNISDEWFFFDQDYGLMRSFDLKSDLLDLVGEDFFLNEITCRK